MGQRTARPAGDNGVERGLVRTLLLHKPLQLGSDFTFAHTGLNETPDVLCGAVGNAACCTDTVDFVSGFYLPQRVERGAAKGGIQRIAPQHACLPAHAFTLKAKTGESFLRNNLIHRLRKRVLRVKQVHLIARRS